MRALRMAAPLFWTLTSILVSVFLCQRTKAATLLSPPSSVYLGDTVRLQCTDRGQNQLTFFKDHSFVKEDSKHMLEHKGNITFLTIYSVSESDEGWYSCGINEQTKSPGKHLSVTAWTRRVSVIVDPNWSVVFVGERLTLRCDVEGGGHMWTYGWRRNNGFLSEKTREYTVSDVTWSDSGDYSCRGERGLDHTTRWSSTTSVLVQMSSAASLSVDPHWPQMFPGEQLTLSCDAHTAEAGGMYEWRKSGQSLHHTQSHIIIRNIRPSDRGSYSCRGVQDHTVTEWSRPLSVIVSDSVPRPLLSVPVSWLSPGASVSLSCAVTAPSAGWSYHWYRAVPQSHFYKYELLPEASGGTTQGSFSVQGLNSTAAFVCRAARGTPGFSTDHSEPSFIWSADAESSTSLSVSPDRAQHFTDDDITLSCGFNSTDTDWRVRRFYNNKLYTTCNKYSRTGQTKCTFHQSYEQSAVYWCESGSGEMSNAVNISAHGNIILVSPVRPVTEGQSVSLGCKLKTAAQFFSFYKNGKLVQNGTKAEFNISAVSRSDQGFYKCEAQEEKKQQQSAPETWTSAESWMSVRTVPKAKEELSSFPVMLVIGSVCAVVLLILLLLLLWCYKIKDLCSVRTMRTGLSSAEDRVTSCDYSSPSDDVTYSVLELENLNGRRNCQQEPDSSADESVTYAQVNHHRRKQTKEKSTLSAPEDVVYAQVVVEHKM